MKKFIIMSAFLLISFQQIQAKPVVAVDKKNELINTINQIHSCILNNDPSHETLLAVEHHLQKALDAFTNSGSENAYSELFNLFYDNYKGRWYSDSDANNAALADIQAIRADGSSPALVKFFFNQFYADGYKSTAISNAKDNARKVAQADLSPALVKFFFIEYKRDSYGASNSSFYAIEKASKAISSGANIDSIKKFYAEYRASYGVHASIDYAISAAKTRGPK